MTVYLNGVARPVPTLAEEVTILPPPSREQLNRIVKQRNTDDRISKVYICVENSGRSYQWVQMAIST